MRNVFLFVVAGLLAACGGGGGSMSSPSASDPGPVSTPTPAFPTAGMRVEETDPAVTMSGTWTKGSASSGWSGGSAVQSNSAGATVSITFIGTSIRWIGSRGRGMGIATVSIDGGPARQVDLFARPADEIHTPIVTLYDLSDAKHTLTITATGTQNSQAQGNVVVVDAFDIQPDFTVSHWQDTNPELTYTAGWIKSSENFPWSGNGVSNLPERPVTAHETSMAGEKMTVAFRGSGISWIGYRGPDAGIATVAIDGGAPTQVDLYAPSATFQPIVFTKTGMTDTDHSLVITATGQMNPAASAPRVVVDALDVLTPGRRYEEYDKSIAYTGMWTTDNDARVWSEGVTDTSNQTGATATFSFTGTSVTWIGCEKDSAAGVANIYVDGVFVKQQKLFQEYPIEGYQMPIFRQDGLPSGPHTLMIQVANVDGSYVVVDAFDVRQ